MRIRTLIVWGGVLLATAAVARQYDRIAPNGRGGGMFAFYDEFPVLHGPYLGQKPPGMSAEVFASGIVTTDLNEHGSPSFSPDLSEMYWSPQFKEIGGGRILFMKMVHSRWQPPQTATFSQDFKNQNPFLSVDGKRIYFKSYRPIDADVYRNGAFWVSERTPQGWSNPKPLGPQINSGSMGQQISESGNRNLYYARERPSGKGHWDIYRVRYASGLYMEPENLGDSINTEFYDSDPYISPDEKILIFGSLSRPDGYGGSDLYISFKNEQGDWTKAVNMGSVINTKEHEDFPMVSPDGKYLFFFRSGDVYWIDAKIIETLIPAPAFK